MKSNRLSRKDGRARITRAVGLLLLTLVALATVSKAQAQDYLDIRPLALQPVPRGFKFQARVSQAKLPVGNAVFETVYINLEKANGENVCSEKIDGVTVQDSVLNLDIGSRMANCDFDSIVEKNSDLTIKVCINQPENCLTAIPLKSVPYAVKSNLSLLAEKADKANQAVECHYTHRATADLKVLTSKGTEGTGYYDFTTPAAFTGTGFEGASNVDGFIRWNPVRGSSNLHICKGQGDTLQKLATLVLHADETAIRGNLTVTSNGGSAVLTVDDVGTKVIGNSSFEGGVVDFTAATRVRFAPGTVEGLEDAVVAAMPDIQGGQDAPTRVSGQIIDGTVTSSDIAYRSIASVDIAQGAVRSYEIADGSITYADLADSQIGGVKIQTGGVTSGHIADGTVSASDIAPSAVGSSELAADSVGSSEIAAGAVGSSELAADSVGSSEIAAGAVGSSEIATNAIGQSELASGAVSNTHITGLGFSQVCKTNWEGEFQSHDIGAQGSGRTICLPHFNNFQTLDSSLNDVSASTCSVVFGNGRFSLSVRNAQCCAYCF